MKLGPYELRIDPVVFFTSAGLIFAFVVFGAVWTETAAAIFQSLQHFIVTRAGWFYALAVAGFLSDLDRHDLSRQRVEEMRERLEWHRPSRSRRIESSTD